MTITVNPLQSPSSNQCNPFSAFISKNICPGRIKGLDMTVSGGVVTIAPGSAYVEVTELKDGVDYSYPLEVFSSESITFNLQTGNEIVIKIPQANVLDGSRNFDLSDIATIEQITAGTGGDFHLVLATVLSTSTVSEVKNSGIRMAGCDYCIECVDGVLQLPTTKINGNISAVDISATGDTNIGDTNISGTLNVSGVLTGDGSGLTNVPSAGIAYMDQTTPGLAQIATNTEANVGTDSTKVIVPSQLKIHTDKYIDSGTINGVGTITITHNLGRTLNIVRFYGENNVASTTGFYDPIQGHKTISNTNGTLAIDNTSLYDVVSGGFSGKVQVSAVTDTTIDLTFTGNFNSDVLYLIEVS